MLKVICPVLVSGAMPFDVLLVLPGLTDDPLVKGVFLPVGFCVNRIFRMPCEKIEVISMLIIY